MLTTTWDGRVRVMYLPDQRMQLRLNLMTVEATVAGQVRAGLTVGYVSGQTYGPPASIAARLRNGMLPPDLVALLGTKLCAAVETVQDGPGRVRWERLDLAELDELAAAWAPYRATVLARQPEPEQQPDPDPELEPSTLRALVGRWADGLWTWLGAGDLRALLAGREPAFGDVRGGPAPGDTAGALVSGVLELPAEIATAAGVAPELGWETAVERDGAWVLRLRARPTGGADTRLLVGTNEGDPRWEPFVADTADGSLVAVLDPDEVRDGGGLRFRTEPLATDGGQP